MVGTASRLTDRMSRNYDLIEKVYTTEVTLETKRTYRKSERAESELREDEMMHRVYRAALKKMRAHAKRDGIALLVHPRITWMNAETKDKDDGFRGILKLRVEAKAYAHRN